MTNKDLKAIYTFYLDRRNKNKRRNKKDDLLLLRLCIDKLLKESEA